MIQELGELDKEKYIPIELKNFEYWDAKRWLLICFLKINLQVQFLSEFGRLFHIGRTWCK